MATSEFNKLQQRTPLELLSKDVKTHTDSTHAMQELQVVLALEGRLSMLKRIIKQPWKHQNMQLYLPKHNL